MNLVSLQQMPQTLDVVERIHAGVTAARALSRRIVVSIVTRTWVTDVFDLFARSQAVVAERIFFNRPTEGFALVGFGSATTLVAEGRARFQQISAARRELLAHAQITFADGRDRATGVGPLLFGGFRFDAEAPHSPLWQGFDDAQLVMPKVLYTQQDDRAYSTFNVVVDADTDASAAAAEVVNLWVAIQAASRPPQPDAPIPATRDLMSAEDWQARVAQAAAAVRAGTYEKLVMARAVQLHQPSAFDLVEALTRLQRDYADCAIFAYTTGGACFLGATPERLAQLQDGCLMTMSLAGSIRRGATPAEDAALGKTLLHSSKDQHEHAIVVRFIAEQLKPLMRDLQFEAAPNLLKLRNVQHLCTPISGEVRAGQTILDLVECLHPTPAVGGRPRHDALQFIRRVEGLDRGWYAAPVGWIDAAGEGEFVVALRSALVDGNVATLFAGCGIVGDSEPEREYLESSLKLRPMTMALT